MRGHRTDQQAATAQVDLSHIRLLVLDEADKVLEAGKGFMEQVDVIYAACSKSERLSTCLFSATLPEWVEQIASSVLHSPTSVVVGAKNVSSLNVDQSLLFVGQVRPLGQTSPPTTTTHRTAALFLMMQASLTETTSHHDLYLLFLGALAHPYLREGVYGAATR